MTVEELYETHIKGLPVDQQLRLLAMIAQEVSSSVSTRSGRRRSLLELEGLGADMWEGTDAQDYVDELRREWDRRA
jgi:hypothetical protein